MILLSVHWIAKNVNRLVVQRKQDQDQGRCTAAYIRAQKDKLMQSVRGPHPDSALGSFYKDMSALCSRPESCINHMHLNAIIGSTAKAWTTAWGRFAQQKQKQAHHQMHVFLTAMFQRLQLLMPAVGARQAANLLWSSAQLGLNPDALVPGMTDSLARQFMVDMDAATGQGFANVLAACAKLQLSPCQGGLVKAICRHLAAVDMSTFGSQAVANTLHSLATLPAATPSIDMPGMTDILARQFMVDMDTATGQGFASVLVACAKLQLSPCQGGLVKAICGRLAAVDMSTFGSQTVANTLHSLATISAAAPSADVLDALCQRFDVLLRSRQAAELPNAQNIANTIWALSKLKHAPSDELALSMVGRMVTLCRLPGQQPKPQEVSNVLLACAELSVPVQQADTDSLASFFLSSNRRQGTQQEYTNIAWSLAVTAHLHQAHFRMMLDQLFALSGNPGEMSTPPMLKAAELTQLYQALDWLQPPPTAPAQQQSAWSSLQGKLHRLGPRPVPEQPSFHGIRQLCAALNQLQLSFRVMVVIQSYWVDAVLQSQDNKAQPVILRLFSPDYITNIPGRSCTTLTY